MTVNHSGEKKRVVTETSHEDMNIILKHNELPQLIFAYVGLLTSKALVPAGESNRYERQKRHQYFWQATNFL